MAEEIAAEYKTSLEDLTFNSKPVINMLTMVAEENIDYAEQIVGVIEERLHKAPPSQKLPVLYLIDSILKNIKNSTYHDLFKTNIVNLFAAVFEKVDEKTRQAMYKLRQTWTDIFDNKKLYSLDIRISQLDPAWPITAKPPEAPVTIHVNPKFLNKQQSASPEIKDKKPKPTPAPKPTPTPKPTPVPNEKTEHSVTSVPATDVPTPAEEKTTEEATAEDEETQAAIREMLLSKQQELIRIQQEKLELELMEARAKLEQQTRQIQAREQQMKLQLLQQLKQNESEACQDVQKENEQRNKTRDPRLNRDPRISSRDPRAAAISNNIGTENKTEKSKKSSTGKDERNVTAKGLLDTTGRGHSPVEVKSNVHVKHTEDANTRGNRKKSSDLVSDSRKDTKKKSTSGDEIRNKSEENKGKVVKSKESTERITKANTKSSKDVKDQPKELEHAKKVHHSHARGSSISPEKLTEVKRNRSAQQDMSRSRERHSRSQSPAPHESKARELRHTENNNDRAQHSSRRDPRGSSSSTHKRPYSHSSRTDDKKPPTHHTTKHTATKKKRDASPSKRKHEESPPEKRVRPSTGKKDSEDNKLESEEKRSNDDEKEDNDDERLSGDLVDLFGKEDKDYRRLPPIPKLKEDKDYRHLPSIPKINVDQRPSKEENSDTMLSPRSAGWSKFKASRPENFPFAQPRSTAVLQRQESCDQFSSPLQSPPTEYRGYRPRARKHLPPDPEGLSADQAGDILKLAEDQLRNGRLTPEQHRELVHQLTELHKLQRLKQQIREEKMKISEAGIIPASLHDPRGGLLETSDALGAYAESEDDYLETGHHPVGTKHLRPRIPRMPPPGVHPRYRPYGPPIRHRGPLLPTPKGHPRPIRGPLLPTPAEPMVDLPETDPDYEMPLDTLLPPEEEPLGPAPPKVRRAGRRDDIPMELEPLPEVPADDPEMIADIDIMPPAGRREMPDYPPPRKVPGEPPGIVGRPRPIRPSPSLPPIRPVYGPTRPLSKQLDVPRPARLPRPRRISGITDDSLVGPDHLDDPENTFEPLAYPWYDTERFYCPHHDARWLKRATFVEGDKSLYLNINNSRIQLPPHNKNREIYNMRTKLVIKFNELERKLYINDEPVYTVGELPRMYYYNNRHFEVSIFGPPQSIWLDGVQYQLHEDAPPEPISLGENVYHFQIDSHKNMVIADGHDICPAGGAPKKIQLNYVVHEIRFDPPPRQILLDGKLCELNLKAKFPYLIIDGKPRGVRFNGSPRQIIIDTVPYMVALDKPRKARVLGPRPRLLAFGGPGHEVIIDDQWYEVKFGAPPKEIKVGARTVHIELRGMPPEVKVLGEYVPVEQIALRAGYPPGSNMATALPNYVTPDGMLTAGQQAFTADGQPMPVTTHPPVIQPGSEGLPVTSQLATTTLATTMGITPYQTSVAAGSSTQLVGATQLQQPIAAQPAVAPLNVSDLLTRLLKAGIIQPQGSQTNNEKLPSDDAAEKMVERESVEEIPSLTDFVPSKLKKQYSGAIQLLSVGIQCASCGLRFVPEQKEKYREHLDWHFRQNKRGKDHMNMPKHRDWYYSVTEWIQYEEIGDLQNRAQSTFFDQVLESSNVQQSQGTRIVPGQVVSCPAVQDGDDICAVCGEVFEQFWDEDEEEWHLRDAMRAEDGKTYHPVCYEDVNESNTSLTETEDTEQPTPDQAAATPAGQGTSNIKKEPGSGESASVSTTTETSGGQPTNNSTCSSSETKSSTGTSEGQETDYSKKLLDMVNNPLAYIASLTKQLKKTSSQSDLASLDEAATSGRSTPIPTSATSGMSCNAPQPSSVITSSAMGSHTTSALNVRPITVEPTATSIYSEVKPVVCAASPHMTSTTQQKEVTATPGSIPITGTPLPTVSSHPAITSSPSPDRDVHSNSSTPVRDEPPSTPTRDEPESGHGTPVEDEPMDDDRAMSGSPVLHIITPMRSQDVKQEP